MVWSRSTLLQQVSSSATISENLSEHLITYNPGTSQVFVAETMALRHGIILVLQHNIKIIQIEGDNLLVVNAVQGLWVPS